MIRDNSPALTNPSHIPVPIPIPDPPAAPPHTDHLDDIFGSSPSPSPSPSLTDSQSPPPQPSQSSEISDIPRLRTIHVTAGYRDGISAAKLAHVQPGFDEGYTLGAFLGLRAGYLVGVLEGALLALSSSSAGAAAAAAKKQQQQQQQQRGDGADPVVDPAVRERVRALCVNARRELDLRQVFGEAYFDAEGVWRWDDGAGETEAEGEVTFREVAERHPLVRKWTAVVEGLAREFGWDLRAVEAEREREREEVEVEKMSAAGVEESG